MKQKFTLEALDGRGWRRVAEGRTSGRGLTQTIPTATARKSRIRMQCDKDSTGVAELQLYAPE
jgi:hypothetical protein